MKIDIYIETDVKGLYRKDRGRTWYLMESVYKEKPIRKKDRVSWLEENRNGAALEGILFALRQVKAKNTDVYVHVNNPYVCGYAKNMHAWKENGYLTKKGTPIKYRAYWESLNEILETQKNRLYFSRDVPEEKKKEF